MRLPRIPLETPVLGQNDSRQRGQANNQSLSVDFPNLSNAKILVSFLLKRIVITPLSISVTHRNVLRRHQNRSRPLLREEHGGNLLTGHAVSGVQEA